MPSCGVALKDFERWFPIQKSAKMHYIENISYDDGIKIKLTEMKGYTAADICKTFVVHFKSYVSYFEVDERFADGFWIDDPTKAWTFYKSKQSPYIDYLRQHRTIPSAVLRRQIFRQMCQKAQRILCGFASILGAYDGKDASKTALEASAANCAVLP